MRILGLILLSCFFIGFILVVCEVVSGVRVLGFSLFIRFEVELLDVEVLAILVFFLGFIEVRALSMVSLTEL